MKNKKLLISVLSAISALCLFGGCNLFASKFSDENKTVQYGSIYTLDSVKTDKDGTEYELQAEVFNSKDKPVAVFGGQFDVLDVNGYTVKYTAYLDGEKSGEWTTTLKVDENIAPVVKFTSYAQTNTYEIGDEFELPTSIVYSVIDKTVTETKKLYKLVDDERTEVEFTDGAFEPTESGKYVYTITATDSKDNANTAEYNFTIRQAPQATELESFNSVASIGNVKTNSSKDTGFEGFSYCSDVIGGVKGSLKITVKANWPQLYLRPRQQINAEEFPWISFKMYVAQDGLDQGKRKAVGVQDANNGQSINRLTTCGKWVEMYASTSAFVESMDENGFGFLFSMNNEGWGSGGEFRTHDEFTAYISDIRLAKSHTVSSEAQLLDVSKADVMQNIHSNYTYSWDFGFDFALSKMEIAEMTGTKLKLTAHNSACSHPNLYVMPVQTLEYYKSKGYTHVNIPLYIDGSTLPNGRTTKKFSFWKVGGSADDMQLHVNTATIVTRSLDDLFSKESNGYISLFQMDNSLDKDSNFVVYVGNVQAVIDNTVLTPFHTYLEKCSATSVMKDGKAVLKVTVQECNQTNMKLYCYTDGVTKQSMIDAGYTKVKFRMYIDSTTLSAESRAKGTKEICVLPHTDGYEYEITQMPFDRWVEFEFDMDRFWKYYNETYKLFAIFSSFNYNNESSNLFLDENFVVYVDGFYGVK